MATSCRICRSRRAPVALGGAAMAAAAFEHAARPTLPCAPAALGLDIRQVTIASRCLPRPEPGHARVRAARKSAGDAGNRCPARPRAARSPRWWRCSPPCPTAGAPRRSPSTRGLPGSRRSGANRRSPDGRAICFPTPGLPPSRARHEPSSRPRRVDEIAACRRAPVDEQGYAALRAARSRDCGAIDFCSATGSAWKLLPGERSRVPGKPSVVVTPLASIEGARGVVHHVAPAPMPCGCSAGCTGPAPVSPGGAPRMALPPSSAIHSRQRIWPGVARRDAASNASATLPRPPTSKPATPRRRFLAAKSALRPAPWHRCR